MGRRQAGWRRLSDLPAIVRFCFSQRVCYDSAAWGTICSMMSPPYTEVRFTLPYSLPFEGEFDFDWAGDSFSVKIENKQVFDERSEAVTGLKFATSGGGSVTIFGPTGLSHL